MQMVLLAIGTIPKVYGYYHALYNIYQPWHALNDSLHACQANACHHMSSKPFQAYIGMDQLGKAGRFFLMKKPLLRPIHRYQRRKWVKMFSWWTAKMWQQVWFSDESKFNLFGSDGRHYC